MPEQHLLVNTEKSTSLHQRDKQHYLPTFNRMPVAFSHGNGCSLWDVEGNKYLDALAGIAVNNLGHNHPSVSATIIEQAQRLLHVSNFFVTEPQVHLAEALTKASGLDYVFFTNSGTESFEGAIKIARKHSRGLGGGGGVISMENSFHGRTMAAIASGKAAMQKGFGPMPEGFKQVPFNNIEALELALTDEVGVIVVEPIQGEGGVRPADFEYLKQLRDICTSRNIVLIFDEIQCGIGRTGTLFAKEYYGVEPDIMILAKGLGNGIPIGAILCSKKTGDSMEIGDHGTTFGGNSLACAVGLTVLQEINTEKFLNEVRRKGELLVSLLSDLKSKFNSIKEIRGRGLMIGVEFDQETKPLVMQLLNNGVVANATAVNVLRLVPPLIISDDEISELVSVLERTLKELK